MSKILTSMFVAVGLFVANTLGVSQLTAAEKTTEKAAVAVMTSEQLQEMLSDLGYEPEQLEPENGAARFSIQVAYNKVDHPVVVTLSRDGKRVTFSAILDPQIDHANASAKAYLKLLELNNHMGAMAFALDSHGGLRLGRTYESRTMTRAAMKKAFVLLGEKIEWSAEHWNAVNFRANGSGSGSVDQHASL